MGKTLGPEVGRWECQFTMMAGNDNQSRGVTTSHRMQDCQRSSELFAWMTKVITMQVGMMGRWGRYPMKRGEKCVLDGENPEFSCFEKIVPKPTGLVLSTLHKQNIRR